MCAHCHSAALEKIETYNLSDSAKKSSQDRLVSAAQEIINIMKLTSHVGAHPKTPLAALSLYCAASVYIYFCETSFSPGVTGKESQAPSYVDNLRQISSCLLWRPLVERTTSLAHSCGLSHTIPLLARSRITRHSGAQPPLPGRLPLGNPIGNIIPDEPPNPPAHWQLRSNT
ncbi:hypothetical protein GGR57DRAFT_9516 [Xylariaceae sp. FL1272]|nr:hypothetical protein GGR57DRAFT_9516 [Xylariaceae sp. FL1272]